MFGGLGNLASLMKRAQQISSSMEGVGESLRAKRVLGSAGGGMVEMEVNGLQEVLQCRIEPGLFAGGDRELVEDLIRAATNDAMAKARQLNADAMKDLLGGDMPGLSQMLGQIEGKIPGAE